MPNILIIRIRAVCSGINKLSCGLACYCLMQFVLNSGKKLPGNFMISTVIRTALRIDIGYFLVKPALTTAYIPDTGPAVLQNNLCRRYFAGFSAGHHPW